MDRVLTVPQIQKLEKLAIERMGIPSVILMENAGRAVAQSILKSFPEELKLRVKVICGVGNNGGDGFVAARHLWLEGVKVEVMICAEIKDLKNDPGTFYHVIKKLDVPIRQIKFINASFEKLINDCDIVIDALFGIGLTRPLEGFYLKVVRAINESRKKVWAVDIPSGLDGSTGKIWGECVQAFTTVSFSCLKKGFLLQDGPRYAGRVETVDIGIPDVLFRKLGAQCK